MTLTNFDFKVISISIYEKKKKKKNSYMFTYASSKNFHTNND